MSRRPKVVRWWPLLACLVLAGVLLAVEVELPVAPAWHMAVQIAIVILVYGLVAWWCYIDDRERGKRVANAQRSPVYHSDPASGEGPANAAMPAPAGRGAVGEGSGNELKVGEVTLRPVPMAPRPGSSSASERNGWNGF